MRFTFAQLALYDHHIPFVHFSPDRARCDAAERDFMIAARAQYFWEDDAEVPWEARFVIAHIAARGSDHRPVVFIEDEKDCDAHALTELLMVAAPMYGIGPMVVR